MTAWYSRCVLVVGCLGMGAGCMADVCAGPPKPLDAFRPGSMAHGQGGNHDCDGSPSCCEPRWHLVYTEQELATYQLHEFGHSFEEDWSDFRWDPDEGPALVLHSACGTDLEVKWLRDRGTELEVGACEGTRPGPMIAALMKPWAVVPLPGLSPETVTVRTPDSRVD